MDIKRLVDLAVTAALAGPARRKRHGAVILKKKTIISSAFNDYTKTHPKVLEYQRFPYPHAETAACVKAGLDNCVGATLCVVRVMGNGMLGISRPCKYCIETINHASFKEVWFSDELGRVVKL